MNFYKADLHIHTVLSPCASLDMGPINIIKVSKEKNLDIIAITDHNSTKNALLIKKMAEISNIFVLTGVEVTTKEEIHCLAYFEKEEELNEFQNILDFYLPDIKNDVDKFGYQLIVNEEEEIIEMEERLLLSALKIGINEIEKKVHELNGLFIPSHINRTKDSVLSQLGFLPPDLNVDALELSRHTTKEDFLKKHKYLQKYNFIQNSDSHLIQDIGIVYNTLKMETINFNEIKQAIKSLNGREVII